jgi:hypothetical protein
MLYRWLLFALAMLGFVLYAETATRITPQELRWPRWRFLVILLGLAIWTYRSGLEVPHLLMANSFMWSTALGTAMIGRAPAGFIGGPKSPAPDDPDIGVFKFRRIAGGVVIASGWVLGFGIIIARVGV